MQENTKAAQEEKLRVMTETPIRPLIFRLALPTIVSMMVTTLYNMADTFFVGHLGRAQTAAVGIVFSFMAIIQAVGFFFGHGSGNYISRSLGRNDVDKAQTMAAVGFFSAFVAGTFILILGLLFLNPLCYLLGARTDELMLQTKGYLRIILIGAPYMTSSLVLNNQLRFQGNAFYAMIGITSGAVLNIALDPLFIFVFNMGVAGAGLATILSQFVGFVLLYRGVERSNNISIRFKNFKPSKELYLTILNGGAPSLFRQGLNSVATMCLNVTAGAYGTAAIAAMSIVTRIMMFANSCLIGFGQGFQPVCGYNYGAGKIGRVKEAFWFCVKLASCVLVVLAALCFAFAPGIVSIFRKGDTEVLQIGIRTLRLQCITFPLAAWVVMSNMMSQTMGKAVYASFLAMARQGLFFVPAVLLLPKAFGILGIEMAQTVADLVTFVVCIPLQIQLLRKMDKEKPQIQ